jgi:prophage regulatory protein
MELNKFSSVSLQRTNLVIQRGGGGRANHYNRIDKGLFVPPVKIGERMAAYPSNEVDAIIAAQISGASDAELRELVNYFIASRKSNPVAVFLASGKQPEEVKTIIRALQSHLKILGEGL